ncbi:MAG: DUF1853 family protein [Verrucomicrobiales bacterium]
MGLVGTDGIFPARFARDLQWVLRCPSLLASPTCFEPPLPPEPLAGLSREPVERFFAANARRRVGYYFESLVRVWLKSLPEISDLEHGVRIMDDRRTLGELDFLFRRAGRLHHLEIALKFYLHFAEPMNGGSRFVGPNAADSFEEKRDKLFGKQLPLGKASFPEIEESGVLMKGRIFYRPDQPEPAELPRAMNPDHGRGTWIRENELEWLVDTRPGDARGTILEKPFWLGGGRPNRTMAELRADVGSHFRRSRRPVLLSLAEPGSAGWEETDRVFVVSRDWPSDGV